MEEVFVLEKYFEKGIQNKNNPDELKKNAVKKGYSPDNVSKAWENVQKKLAAQPILQTQQNQKKGFSRIIPIKLRFPLIWTLFFVVLGIVIQSMSAGEFVFLDFFGYNFINWIKSMGSFTNPTFYQTRTDILIAFVSKWYYFLIAGGILSIIWALISLAISGDRIKPQPIIIEAVQ